MQVSPSRWARGDALVEGKPPPITKITPHPYISHYLLTGFTSLGWVELRTVLSKLYFSYDLELLDKELDWQRDSKMHTLWQKPALQIRVKASPV